jgi:hypothetical protein
MKWTSRRGGDPFVGLVTEVFGQVGWNVEVDRAGTIASVQPPGQGQLTLQPLRDLCVGQPQGSWRAIIAEHVLPFVAAMDGLPELSDWTAVQPTLRTRLRHHTDPAVDDATLSRPLADGLRETVVIDTPLTAVGFDADLLDDLPVTPDQVLAEARG